MCSAQAPGLTPALQVSSTGPLGRAECQTAPYSYSSNKMEFGYCTPCKETSNGQAQNWEFYLVGKILITLHVVSKSEIGVVSCFSSKRNLGDCVHSRIISQWECVTRRPHGKSMERVLTNQTVASADNITLWGHHNMPGLLLTDMLVWHMVTFHFLQLLFCWTPLHCCRHRLRSR